jgi:hypothetical protein
MESMIAAMVGALLGALLKYLYDRYTDRSAPIGSVLRVGLTTTVPKGAREVFARFPEALAIHYNTSPVMQENIDSAKEVPLEDYAKQVHEIREDVRIQLGIQGRGLETLESLFKALDRNDHMGFAKIFAEHDDFLFGWMRGRTLRGQSPPEVPTDVIEPSSVTPRPGLAPRVQENGDYIVDIAGHVQLILLVWSTKQTVPEKGKLCQKVAGGIARAIAEFRIDELRGSLGAVESDIKTVVDELRALLGEVTKEEERYSFLEVTALMRNRGRRAYAVDSVARVFVAAAGYTFTAVGAGAAPVSLSDDIDVDLVSETDAANLGFVVVKPGDATVVRFLTKLPLDALSGRDALESIGRHGGRSCRLGVRLFREGTGPELYYAPAAPFRMFDAGTTVPRPS